MSINIRPFGFTFLYYKLYNVTFFDDTITTLVTSTPSIVEAWISAMERLHHHQHLIVGLHIQWKLISSYAGAATSAATLQLCIGHNCLVFQIIHASSIPQTLINFLSNGNYTFVGVKIGQNIDKLLVDYRLEVTNAVDLRFLAAERLNDPSLRKTRMVELASEVLGKGFDKPRWVEMSDWDAFCLSVDQIKYACLDAFVSFEIGRSLGASDKQKTRV